MTTRAATMNQLTDIPPHRLFDATNPGKVKSSGKVLTPEQIKALLSIART